MPLEGNHYCHPGGLRGHDNHPDDIEGSCDAMCQGASEEPDIFDSKTCQCVYSYGYGAEPANFEEIND